MAYHSGTVASPVDHNYLAESPGQPCFAREVIGGLSHGLAEEQYELQITRAELENYGCSVLDYL